MSRRKDFNVKYDPESYNDENYFESHDEHPKGFNSYQEGEGILNDLFSEVDKLFADIVEKKTHLDVACAYGWSVLTMQNKGWKSQGFDYAQYAVDHQPPGIKVYQGDGISHNTWKRYKKKQFGLVTANEFFEHVPTDDAIKTISEMARVADWGFFTISADTTPRNSFDDDGIVHGHLNCHDISFWISEFDKVGQIDYELMHEFNKFADGYNPGIKWHCRTLIVKFDSDTTSQPKP